MDKKELEQYALEAIKEQIEVLRSFTTEDPAVANAKTQVPYMVMQLATSILSALRPF
jgi:hypothetical protein